MAAEVLVVGASGVVGTAATERFAAEPGARVTALSRRPPVVRPDLAVEHLSADLADHLACARELGKRPPFTHVVYCAVDEAAGLVSGWSDPERIERNATMLRNVLDPVAARGALQHVSLLQGTKAYGAHLHDARFPLREDTPRDAHSSFYWLQEDHVRALAGQHGFRFTILRPQVVVGWAPGAAMNPAVALGAYAALCLELGQPAVAPAPRRALWELVDARLLADVLAWAAATPAADGEVFNVTNGDLFVLHDSWPELASRLGAPVAGGEAPTGGLVDFFAQPRVRDAWRRLVARHGLREPSLDALLGQSHHYVDLLLSTRLASREVPIVVSTIKLREAGFGGCRDSTEVVLEHLQRLSDERFLPPWGPAATSARPAT